MWKTPFFIVLKSNYVILKEESTNDKKAFHSVLSLIVPNVIKLIKEAYSLNEIESVKEFYSSLTYEKLENEETGLWHFSLLTLFYMYKGEKVNGIIEFSEEG